MSRKELNKVYLKVGKYENGNLCIQIFSQNGEPLGSLTANCYLSLPDFYICVDLNNFPSAENFIRNNDLATPTGMVLHSGFCEYPIYVFNENMLEEIEVQRKAR